MAELFERRTPGAPLVYSIPAHRSFSDALAIGLINSIGRDPLALAQGRILLPNNRAVRTVTEAFVRASGGGLLLPRLIPIGDPELEERIGGALDPIDRAEPVPPTVEPTERLLKLASIARAGGESSAEGLRLAADLSRTLDALSIDEIDPRALRTAVADRKELAQHWERSLERLQLIVEHWPGILAERGEI